MIKIVIILGLILCANPLFALTADEANAITIEARKIFKFDLPEQYNREIKRAASSGDCFVEIFYERFLFKAKEVPNPEILKTLRNLGYKYYVNEEKSSLEIRWGDCKKDFQTILNEVDK